MIYDESCDALRISVAEFVTTARRGISAALPYDEDEPRCQELSKRELSSLLGDFSEESLSLEVAESDERLTLYGRARIKADGTLAVAMLSDRDGASPSRELIARARGEGFILAYMMMQKSEVSSVSLTVSFLNRALAKNESREEVKFSAAERFFKKCLSTVLNYSRPERDRVKKRIPTMRAVKFPYKSVREGQSEFVRRAYRTLARGGTLFANAPTGTGKTVSAIFPAVRAMGEGKIKKVFYLTPKTTTATAAKECIELLCQGGADIKAIVLSAKERTCKNGLRCKDGRDMCENSKCNRLAEAALRLYDSGVSVVTSQMLDPIAREYTVCPYELELTYAELCDLVICDFNYLFDPRVYIRRFFDTGGDFAFLVDEAHNLPDRAREMFSAEISAEEIASPALSELLGEFSEVKSASLSASKELFSLLYPYVKDEILMTKDGDIGATHLSELPGDFYGIFERLISVCEEEINTNVKAKDEERGARLKLLRDYYYKVKRVYDTALAFDSDYRLFIFYEHAELRIKLYCVDTGRRISDRIAKGRSAVFFSATLAPLEYYKATLGADGTSDYIEVDSPFAPEQLSVAIMDKISTRFSEREDTLLAVCRAVAATLSAKRGNYIVFSPSFSYSEALAKIFKAKYPKIRTLVQGKNMSAEEKRDFLSAFESEDSSYLVAFCVMGGIFSEGIDLAGESLIGAVVVGIGLPQISYEREAIAEYFNEKYEAGKEFAYVYPGINRVLQAAGRVIRREDDRGVIVLIDDRFDDPIYKKSLPRLWRGVRFISDPKELKASLEEFWHDAEKT